MKVVILRVGGLALLTMALLLGDEDTAFWPVMIIAHIWLASSVVASGMPRP